MTEEAAQTRAAVGDIDVDQIEADEDLIDVPLVFDKEGNTLAGFKVYGANSEQYQEAVRKVEAASVKRAFVRGRPLDGRSDSGAREVLDNIERRELAIVLGCIAESYGFVKGDNAKVEASDLTMLLTKKRPAWRRKLLAAIEAGGNSERG